jgi:two-component system response regulator
MENKNRNYRILIVEDDDDDFLLAQKAMQKAEFSEKIYRVDDGEELINYLQRQGGYQDATDYPRPNLILLDLNMPKIDGRQALKIIKSDSTLKDIPIIVMTTSTNNEDIAMSYALGANSFIKKPVILDQMIEVMRQIKNYWFATVELPEDERDLNS